MRGRSLTLLSVAVVMLLCIPVSARKEFKYSLYGRVVDSSGHPVVGASVFLDPPVWAHQVFGATTEADGRFSLKESTTVPNRRRRLYVTGPEPANTARLIHPPFNLLPRLTGRAFAGLPVELKEHKNLNVGDVTVQVNYGVVKVYVQDRAGGPLLTTAEAWKYVYLRLRDEQNNIVTESTLSQNNIETAVNLAESSVNVALPEGVWRVELSADGPEGPWLTSNSPLNMQIHTGAASVVLRSGIR